MKGCSVARDQLKSQNTFGTARRPSCDACASSRSAAGATDDRRDTRVRTPGPHTHSYQFSWLSAAAMHAVRMTVSSRASAITVASTQRRTLQLVVPLYQRTSFRGKAQTAHNSWEHQMITSQARCITTVQERRVSVSSWLRCCCSACQPDAKLKTAQ
jgi:hypothetical protein